MDSVPPLDLLAWNIEGDTDVQSKRGRDENRGKAPNPVDKGRISDVPIPIADIGVGRVPAAIDCYSKDDKNLNH